MDDMFDIVSVTTTAQSQQLKIQVLFLLDMQ